jgi:hypothetical protein
MRTTIDIPDDMLQAAKIRAAERGETLKELVTRAVARDLGLSDLPAQRSGRVRLPLVGQGAAPSVEVTNADIAAALESEDVERYRPR